MEGAVGGDIVGTEGTVGEKLDEFRFGLPVGIAGMEGALGGAFEDLPLEEETCFNFGTPPAKMSPNCGAEEAKEEEELPLPVLLLELLLFGNAGAPPKGGIPIGMEAEAELDEFPTSGADLSFVTAFFNAFPFLMSPKRAFLSGVVVGRAGAEPPIGGGIPGGGGGGGGGGPAIVCGALFSIPECPFRGDTTKDLVPGLRHPLHRLYPAMSAAELQRKKAREAAGSRGQCLCKKVGTELIT